MTTDLITTTKGPMDPSLLEKREGAFEDDNEVTRWTEYWLSGELVHRSVHVHLKQAMFADGVVENFS